ncbi:MAG: pilus assembly protein CpaE [Clostridia bacterium]|nr:pilus assembly protein CpaE [Clostridia bacterium]
MERKIRIIIVDDSEQTRENIHAIFGYEESIEIIGEGQNGLEAVALARELRPDVILMDINMPEMDGIKATQTITEEGFDGSVIIMSIQGEKEYIKKAMSAGARDYVIKPFGVNELIEGIRRVYQLDQAKKKKIANPISGAKLQSKVISVFSTKGGVGKTTVATNLAVAIATTSKKKVALLDLDLQFGDVAISLNLYVKNTITELVKDLINVEHENDMIEEYMLTHYSGVKVLAAPTKPENAEYVNSEHIKKIIGILKSRFEYIIIDTAQGFDDTVITALDDSDTILYVSTLDLPSIKNTKNGLEVMKTLNYSSEKVRVVVNKSNESFGIKHLDFKAALNVDLWAIIPDDLASVAISVNNGHPLVSHRRSSVVSKRIFKLAQTIVQGEKPKQNIFKIG